MSYGLCSETSDLPLGTKRITNIAAGAFCLLAAKLFCALHIFVQKSFKSIYQLFTNIHVLANTTSSVIMYRVVNFLTVKLVYVPLYTLLYDNIEL